MSTAQVQLVLPCAPAYVRLARLVASGLAGDCGFTVAEIDELRIAVDELVHVLIEGTSGDDVDITYTVDDEHGEIRVEGLRTRMPDIPEPDPLVSEILAVAVDDWRLELVEDGVRFALVKRRRYDG